MLITTSFLRQFLTYVYENLLFFVIENTRYENLVFCHSKTLNTQHFKHKHKFANWLLHTDISIIGPDVSITGPKFEP